MHFYVYENWQAEGHKARVHFHSCPWCKSGRGIYPHASKRNGRWHGPFSSLSGALSAASRTGARVSRCKKCSPA